VLSDLELEVEENVQGELYYSVPPSPMSPTSAK